MSLKDCLAIDLWRLSMLRDEQDCVSLPTPLSKTDLLDSQRRRASGLLLRRHGLSYFATSCAQQSVCDEDDWFRSLWFPLSHRVPR